MLSLLNFDSLSSITSINQWCSKLPDIPLQIYCPYFLDTCVCFHSGFYMRELPSIRESSYFLTSK